MSILTISHLSKYFIQGKQTTLVLDNATYSFQKGQSVAIMGVSGTGKSTLMHLLAGLDTPTGGSVFFDGTELFQLDGAERALFLRKAVGLLLQVPTLLGELSVIENILLPGLIVGEKYGVAYEKAQELLAKVGLLHKKETAVGTLSGGEQQRIALARALFSKPAFILADEPTAHLDAHTKDTIMQLLLTCQQEWGMGLIIATHDEAVAQQMDTVLRLDKGKLLQINDVAVRISPQARDERINNQFRGKIHVGKTS